MLYTDLTKKSMKIAYEAHKGQPDKGGLPYIFHPMHLAEQMNTEEEVCVALLHDVMEDNKSWTPEALVAEGIPAPIIETLVLMTHHKPVDYFDYLRLLKSNPVARKVKLADLAHNSDISRLDCIDDEARDRLEKYRKALGILNTNYML